MVVAAKGVVRVVAATAAETLVVGWKEAAEMRGRRAWGVALRVAQKGGTAPRCSRHIPRRCCP